MVRLIKEEFYNEQYYSILRTLREYLNSELKYENINGIEFSVSDIYNVSSQNACAFEITMQDPDNYLREAYAKIVSSEDLYAEDLILYYIGDSITRPDYREISRFGAGEKLLRMIKDEAASISTTNESVRLRSKSRKTAHRVTESSSKRRYYDPQLDQFEIYLMTNGTNGHDEIRDYVDSRRNTGVFGSFGSEYGSVSVYVNTDNIDDDFVNEVEDLIIFAQDHGARLNVPCYNELKDLFTVKHVAYDI
jgi:hypothetical protein